MALLNYLNGGGEMKLKSGRVPRKGLAVTIANQYFTPEQLLLLGQANSDPLFLSLLLS